MSAATALSRRYPPALLQRYASSGHRAVQGWLYPVDITLILALGAIQTDANLHGAVGEIGVHHGRLAILLYLMLHKGERGWCIDIFEQQHLNIDGSGKGDSAIFRTNIERHGVRAADIEIIAAASDTVRAADLIAAVGKTRLMSIDGGHTAETTLCDLRLAQEILCESGVVIVDDVFNKDWPGVVDGLIRFLGQSDHDLQPVAIAANKLILCRRPQARFYRKALQDATPLRPELVKASVFLGHEMLIFGRDSSMHQLSLAQTLRRSGPARAMRWYMSRLRAVGSGLRSVPR